MELKHFIEEQDFSKEELLDIIETIKMIKEADRQGATPQLLKGASLGMIFEEPSTRTRISFEVAMTELGGHALYLKPGEIHLGERESLSDTALVVSRMVDVVMIRALEHETVTEFAKYSSVPVINGITSYNHPTQVLCDVLTMMEHMPAGKKLEDLNVTYNGIGNSQMLISLMLICTRMGMKFTAVFPKGFEPDPKIVEIARGNCSIYGGSLKIMNDPVKAIVDADFIHSDLWWWVGEEESIPERRAAFMPNYQLTMDLLKKAPAHCKVMHCLPTSRNVEATDEVLDSPQSIIFDQAENRLHTEKGLLVWLTYPHLKKPSEALKAYHKGRIESFVTKKLMI